MVIALDLFRIICNNDLVKPHDTDEDEQQNLLQIEEIDRCSKRLWHRLYRSP